MRNRRYQEPLRIVLIADTHGQHAEVRVPDGDILIHAGDISLFGNTRAPFAVFDDWLASLPHPHKIVIPGNHDGYLEDPKNRRVIRHAHLLISSMIELMGLRIWGSPVMPYQMVPFGVGKSSDRRQHWGQMPTDLDILVTHIPPFGVLDVGDGGDHEGCIELLHAVEAMNPSLHVFGHVHGQHGVEDVKGTRFVNACLAGKGELDRHPIRLLWNG